MKHDPRITDRDWDQSAISLRRLIGVLQESIASDWSASLRVYEKLRRNYSSSPLNEAVVFSYVSTIDCILK